MKISYVTTYDAKDVHSWSGTGYNIAKSLEDKGVEIDYVGELRRKLGPSTLLRRTLYNALGKKYRFDRDVRIARHYAEQAEERINRNSQVLFSPGVNALAFIKSNKPKVFYTDATFASMINFYEGFTNMSAENIRNGHLIEQTAIDSAALAIFSSDWAAQSAINDYNADPAKVKVVPFGANIVCNRTLDDIKIIVGNRSETVCNLLFLGVEWDRKGGDMAMDVARLLNERGLKTILHITGIKELPFENVHDFVVNHGFISKATEEGQKKIDKLLAESHFLILPSKADCTPIVYAEVNSFGLPCITTNVGGITSLVTDDVNGKTFGLNESAASYADYIAQKFFNGQTYKDLCYSSFNEYETRLNWKKTGELLFGLMKEVI
ncbi:glycosyltransferase [Pedobacter sp. HMF7647]|uniref:Glycosyltransferase n=1 Tax=Hufsiella arboris TaxID=2695275 RepID=A0A7K1YC00_9SPHI|nr:glycosyltransferase family 4 protein [Hufsiella arboris]MXV52117.1 glycosyltransferase [Hufsiella arboris]